MPTFMEAEDRGSDAGHLCHGLESGKIRNQLSLCICGKLMPVVREQLELANERGELAVRDPGAAASFAVYGQLGILLDQSLPAKERAERIRIFLLEMVRKWKAEER